MSVLSNRCRRYRTNMFSMDTDQLCSEELSASLQRCPWTKQFQAASDSASSLSSHALSAISIDVVQRRGTNCSVVSCTLTESCTLPKTHYLLCPAEHDIAYQNGYSNTPFGLHYRYLLLLLLGASLDEYIARDP